MLSTWPTNTTAAIEKRAVGYTGNDASGAFLSTVLGLVK
jgi:hypothetical protein